MLLLAGDEVSSATTLDECRIPAPLRGQLVHPGITGL